MAEDPRHRTNTAGPAEPALDPAGPRRDTVGRILRRGRERDGLRLRDVADALRIRYDYLDAIERSEFDALPGATYAIGFVRSYASYLALDDEAIVRQFKQEVRGLNRTQDLSFPEPVNEGKVPGKALLLVSLVFVGAAYGGWHYLSQSPDRQISDMVPAVPDRLKAFLDDGGSTSPSEDAGSASVTDFAEGGDGAAAGADDGSSPSADGTAASGTDMQSAGTAPDAAERGDTAAEPRAAPDSPEGSTAGADTAQTAGAQEAAPATQADAPQVPPEAAPETPDATSGTARRDSAGATETATTAGTSTGEPAATGDAGAGASTTPDQTSEPGAPTTTDTGDPATAVPEAPSSAPGNADATQTASVPDAPDPDGGAAGTAGAGEAAATGTPSGDGATAGTDPAAATNDGADDAAADGIPEPPSPTGGSADGTAAADGIGGPQSAALPDTAGGDAEPAAGVNGAQAQVLAQAERVFGPANGRSRMLLRATQDSWVQVRGADDSPLLTRVLNPGDVYRVPDQDGLILHTGNAGGLKVYIDGNPAGSLGQTGEVKRNVTLSPDAMR